MVDDSANIDSIGNAELRGYLARENGRPREENPYAELASSLEPNSALRARAELLAEAWWRGWDWD